MASRVVNMTIPEELLRQIDDVAQAEGFTRSELFRQAARHYVQKRSAKRKTSRPVLKRLISLAEKGQQLSAMDLDATLYGKKRKQ